MDVCSTGLLFDKSNNSLVEQKSPVEQTSVYHRKEHILRNLTLMFSEHKEIYDFLLIPSDPIWQGNIK